MSQFEKNQKQVFSEQLKTAMKNWNMTKGKKLTQQALANAVSVQRETVSRWINGKNCPLEDDLVMKRLCEFFNVPRDYFSQSRYLDGWTMIDKKTHFDLNASCDKIAKAIGLSEPFIAFLKGNPLLADAVIQTSWVDGTLQSFSPDVPEMPENLYQFISSSGIKIYPPQDVLYMLRVIQRDTEEYLHFLIEKYKKIYDQYRQSMDAFKKGLQKDDAQEVTDQEKIYHLVYPIPPAKIFAEMLHGPERLSIEEDSLVKYYRSINPEGKKAVFNTLLQEREIHPTEKEKALRDALRKARKDHKPLPPQSEILPEDSENGK